MRTAVGAGSGRAVVSALEAVDCAMSQGTAADVAAAAVVAEMAGHGVPMRGDLNPTEGADPEARREGADGRQAR
jgi:hypothetical protein